MKKKIIEELDIPEDIECRIERNQIICTRNGQELTKSITLPEISAAVSGRTLKIESGRANKKTHTVIKALAAHIRNIFLGLQDKFVYELEICNVHFPMTVKVEDSNVIINNFLGEKVKRSATILPGVAVEVKGQKIIVSGHDIEAIGQTAANIEKSTLISKRDRRVFQDGIFVISKAGRPI